MVREQARELLKSSQVTRELLKQTIYALKMELRYIYQSRKENWAQETQSDIRESQELLDQLEAKLASLE